MCGFVVIVTGDRPVVFDVLQEMTDRIAHRGPDDHGYAWISGDGRIHEPRQGFGEQAFQGILFGHRRLSILDLSDAAHQPFRSRDGRYLLVYNGEVFNYVELREELRQLGHEFHSGSDTEVVLTAYQHWGRDAFARFNGMWSLAIWDGHHQRLVLSRDRFGIKPLYVAQVRDAWLFASEIKSLHCFPGIGHELNDARIYDFLTRGVMAHTVETCFTRINVVPPSTIMELRNGSWSQSRYWSIATPKKKRFSGEVVDEFRSLLTDAVRIRLRSDVPLGTMLSGGLDSTSITTLIARRKNDAQSSVTEPTGVELFHCAFSACWPGSGAVDEEREIDLLSSQLGLVCHKIYPTAEEIADVLPQVVECLDEPFETPVSAVQYLLMKKAREHGVKVVLNGHGSDETLAGYPDMFLAPFLAGLLVRGKWSGFRAARNVFPWVSTPRILRELAAWLVPRATGTGWRRPHAPASASHAQFFTDHKRREREPAAVADDTRGTTPLERALLTTFRVTILPGWLNMEDRVSMAHSVESRLPFLDYRLVEFNFQLDDQLKLDGGYTKAILRRAMRDILPHSLVDDRRKRRFSLPYLDWLRTTWRPLGEELLLSGECRVGPYVNLPVLRQQLSQFYDGKESTLRPWILWRILQTEMWLRSIVCRPAAGAVGARQ